MVGLAKHPAVDKYDISSLRMVISGAAPLGSEVQDAVKERTGISVKQGWGMSELSPLGTFQYDYNSKTGSVGNVISNTHAKIVHVDTGKSLGPNETGEVIIKGPQVMLGYLDDPVATKQTLSESGWLRTGDVGYYDEDGFFYITDRAKELIKVKGMQVAPAELEALLLTNEHVKDVAVTSVPSEEFGELPRAFVVLKDDTESKAVTGEEIQEWVKERVARFKQLGGGVVFIDQIPKSASGKILRRLLKDEAKDSES